MSALTFSVSRKSYWKNKGFTLPEMLVVLCIVGILAAFAFTSYTNMINNQNVAAEANALVVDLQFARSEAIKRGIPVNVCAANAAATACSGAADWSTGWITNFVANPTAGTALGSDNILRLQSTFRSKDTMVSGSTQTLCTIGFNRYGFYQLTSTCTNATGAGSITFAAPNCPAGSTYGCMKTVCVNAIGKVAIVTGGNSLCPV